mgnify:CR=1 FL=1|jgi:hypothetical protein
MNFRKTVLIVIVAAMIIVSAIRLTGNIIGTRGKCVISV